MNMHPEIKYKYSDASAAKLNTCDHHLAMLFNEVIKHVDCTIIDGHRIKSVQDNYYNTGRSKVRWPNSKHNTMPSRAVDAAPYIAGEGVSFDTLRCYYFAGIVKGIAGAMHIDIRWGGDWDNDNDIHDQQFNDLVHFELR